MMSSLPSSQWLPNATRTAWTATRPPFIMMFVDPALDLGVSRAMATTRAIEPGNALFWQRALLEPCQRNELMLDIGANFGYYSLLAAVMGCHVIAWEPVPAFRAMLELASKLNNVSDRINIRGTAASHESGRSVPLAVPRRGLWGTASMANMHNLDVRLSGGLASGTVDVVNATTETIDSVVFGHTQMGEFAARFSTSTIAAIKIDVEGHEPHVLFGAERTLRLRPPRSLFIEYTPGVAERRGVRHGQWDEVEMYPRALALLRSCDFHIWHLGGNLITSQPSWLPCTRGRFGDIPNCEYSRLTLPSLREVTDASVHAERRNALNLAAEPRAGLARGRRRAGSTFHVPWDLHPKSLHAEFTHNTDLLATRRAMPASPLHVVSAGPVGVHSWSTYGLGGGLCSDVARDAPLREVVGRLCLPPGSAARNASIDRASAHAERNRTSESGRAFDVLRRLEAERWRKVSAEGGREMKLVRFSDEVPPSPPPLLVRLPPLLQSSGRAPPPPPTAVILPPLRQQQPSHPEQASLMMKTWPATTQPPALQSLQAAAPTSQPSSSSFNVESISAISRLGALVGVVLFATRRGRRCCRAGSIPCREGS